MADFESNLDDDQASYGRSVVSPLDELGIDPDEAITNRAATMAKLNQSPMQRMQQAYSAGATPTSSAIESQPPTATNSAPPKPVPTAYSSPAPRPPAATPPTPDPKSSAQVTPSGTTVASPSVSDYGLSGLAGLQKNLDEANNEANQIPTVDTASPTLEAQLASDTAARPQAYDPSTGKLNPQYKTSVGTKILRGLEGAGLGLAAGGVHGLIAGSISPSTVGVAGYGAPSAQYGRDVERNAQTIASDTQQLTEAQAAFKAAQDARKARATELRANAGLGKDLVTGATGLQNAATDAAKIPIEQQRVNNESPEAKLQLTEGLFSQRGNQADRLGLKGQTRTLYMLNGKVPDPRQATGEEIAAGQALRIFTQQYGHPPQTIDEYRQVQDAARGGADKSAVGPGGVKLSADEQKKADLAQNLNENLDNLEEIITRRPELVGAWGGRLTGFKAAMGTNDPDIAAMENIRHNLGMVALGTHGMRSAQGIEAAANSIVNDFHNGPDAIKGAIANARNSAKTFIGNAQGERTFGPGSTPVSGTQPSARGQQGSGGGGFTWGTLPASKKSK